MAKAIEVQFVLVGPRAGEDFVPFEGVKFVKGKFKFVGSSDQVEGLENLLRVTHNAHVEGSKAHADAERAWESNAKNPVNVRRAEERAAAAARAAPAAAPQASAPAAAPQASAPAAKP